jgi:hypothetical protein
MGKIPVGRTILQSYGFAFGGYLRTLRVIWLPMLASAALTFFLRGPLTAQLAAQAHAQGQFSGLQFQGPVLLLELAGFLLLVIMSVGITKEVLGLPRGSRFFYAGFGAAELRVIVGYLALFLLFVVFVVAFVIALALIGSLAANSAHVPKAAIVSGVGLLALVLWLALIYAMVRLTFLFLPVTVGEHRIGILHGWELTKGNFWRIFAIGIVVLLPLVIIGIFAIFALLGPGYLDFAIKHQGDQAAIQAYAAQHMMGFYENLPAILVVQFITAPVVYGLMIAPAAFAYRTLVPLEPIETAPPPLVPDAGLPEPLQEGPWPGTGA